MIPRLLLALLCLVLSMSAGAAQERRWNDDHDDWGAEDRQGDWRSDERSGDDQRGGDRRGDDQRGNRRQGRNGRGGDRAGVFDYYALTLSWSPTYCEDASSRHGAGQQCDGRRPYAFVLHGLWPQFDKGWPQSCWTPKKEWVSKQTIDQMLDIMPSRDLIIHEYREHGTCSGMAPDAYFEAARQAFESIRIPARYLSPTQPITVTPAEIEEDFAKSNAGLTADMIAVACSGKRRLREVRICFSRDLKPTACGQNENQKRLCSIESVVMPPVRGGAPNQTPLRRVGW